MSALYIILAVAQGSWLQQEVDLARKASAAAVENLVSGDGEGEYETAKRAKGEQEWTTFNAAKVRARFKGRKFHVDLHYSVEPYGLERRTIVFDGSALAMTRFSKLIHPAKSKTDLFDVQPVGDRSISARIAGFGFDVARLPYQVLNFSFVDKLLSPKTIQVLSADRDRIIAEYYLGRTRMEFECASKDGYNVRRFSAYNPGKDEPAGQFDLEWQQTDGVWYVKSISDILVDAVSGSVTRTSLRYDRFEVNPELDDELFTLKGLEMTGGSRILDQRPGAVERAHFNPLTNAQVESQMDGLVAQVESLPTSRSGVDSGMNAGTRTWRNWIIAANVVLVLTVVAFLIRRRMRRKA